MIMTPLTLVLITLGLVLLVLLAITRGADRGGRRGATRGRAVTCSHLGLADDPLTQEARPTERHRCYFQMQRERIDLAHQQSFCLSATFPRCPWLMTAPTSARAGSRWTVDPTRFRLWIQGAHARIRWAAEIATTPAAHYARAVHRWLAPAVRAVVVYAGPRLRPALVSITRAALLAMRWLVRMVDRGVRWTAPRLALLGERAYRWLAPRLAASARALMTHAPRLVVLATANLRRFSGWLLVADRVQQPAPVGATLTTEPSESAPQPVQPPPSLPKLLERGLAALEAQQEELAYELFVQASSAHSRDARAWFWRAKTAPALAEMVACLERAASLAHDNDQIRVNLDWAQARVERERAAASLAKQADSANPPRSVPLSLTRVGSTRRLARACAHVVGTTSSLLGATACLALGALWIAGALPQQLVAGLDGRAASLLRLVPQLDLSAVRGTAEMATQDGYDALSALPYVLGFLAFLAAAGLLSREGWARWWAPLVAVASAGLWLNFSTVGLPPQMLLGLCTLITIASPLTPLGSVE